MTLQHYAVIDAATKAWKRFGTCQPGDLASQASEPNELAIPCPADIRDAIMTKQRGHAAKRNPPDVGNPHGRFMTDQERGPPDLPYKVDIVGGLSVIVPILPAIATKKPK